MDKFERESEPEILAVTRRDLNASGERTAPKLWKAFRRRRIAYRHVRDHLLAISQGACAFCGRHFIDTDEKTIEHFAPKSGPHAKPEKVLHWDNLFPACSDCQAHKDDKYPHGLLKPDHDDYAPEQFFLIDMDDGSLNPLPFAAPELRAMAETTIETYGLQRPGLVSARFSVLKTILDSSTDEPLDSFRFMERLFAS